MRNKSTRNRINPEKLGNDRNDGILTIKPSIHLISKLLETFFQIQNEQEYLQSNQVIGAPKLNYSS